MRDRKLISSLL